MNLSQLHERLSEGKYPTDKSSIKCNNKEYTIDFVHIDDFSDGLFQLVIELKDKTRELKK